MPIADPITAKQGCSIIAFEAIIKFANREEVPNLPFLQNMGHLFSANANMGFERKHQNFHQIPPFRFFIKKKKNLPVSSSLVSVLHFLRHF